MITPHKPSDERFDVPGAEILSTDTRADVAETCPVCGATVERSATQCPTCGQWPERCSGSCPSCASPRCAGGKRGGWWIPQGRTPVRIYSRQLFEIGLMTCGGPVTTPALDRYIDQKAVYSQIESTMRARGEDSLSILLITPSIYGDLIVKGTRGVHVISIEGDTAHALTAFTVRHARRDIRAYTADLVLRKASDASGTYWRITALNSPDDLVTQMLTPTEQDEMAAKVMEGFIREATAGQ